MSAVTSTGSHDVDEGLYEPKGGIFLILSAAILAHLNVDSD
jgi:hypothetical protein